MELLDHPFFTEVEAKQGQELANQTLIETFEGGSMIFEEGSPSDGLYLVLEGEVVFKKKIAEGEYRSISFSKSGDFFGEIGLFTKQPRSLRAESLGRVKIAIIPSEDLMNFIQSARGSIDSILQSIINHLHSTTQHYVQDLLQKEKMAVVGSMTNTIVHDFKNPFCLISLGAQLIQQMHADDKTQKLCKNIEDQIQRMVAMAEEISEFSRGQHTLNLRKVNLKNLMMRFQELNFPYFEKENIRIRIKVPDIDLPGEENKLLRVFQNLVGNALEAFENSEGEILIEGSLESDKTVLIKVSDNAGGIPEEIRPRFFEPFVTFGKSKGTGLGTAIAKSIIDAHGGLIYFETKEGEGTVFFIRLPTYSGSA